jgi:hypothetical protein
MTDKVSMYELFKKINIKFEHQQLFLSNFFVFHYSLEFNS